MVDHAAEDDHYYLDSVASYVLNYLADQYRPVSSEWVDTSAIASAIGVDEPRINERLERLVVQGLIELSSPDEEFESYAAVITVKGLRALGRAP